MNIERGIHRISYVFIGFVWFCGIVTFLFSEDKNGFLWTFVGISAFTLGYFVLLKAFIWVIRGFKE